MFDYYGPVEATQGIPLIQFIWLAIVAFLGLAMIMDKNVMLFVMVIPALIKLQVMKFWFLIRFMPMFWLTRWTMERRMKKMAAELLKDLEADGVIVPQEDEEVD